MPGEEVNADLSATEGLISAGEGGKMVCALKNHSGCNVEEGGVDADARGWD